MARLGDIFTITSGGTPDKKKSEYYANGTIPWVKTGDLKNQYVPTGIECITEEGLKNSSAKLFPPNTVLVAMYGATIGACSILPYEASTNQACAAFLPNEKVMPTYLYYFLSSKKEQFIKDGVGGAQPNVSAGYLKNVQFDLIPMQQQINMVSTLDKVSELFALRKEQLAKLDQLIKSRFIELFGDPITNSNNLPTERMELRFNLKAGITTAADDIHEFEEGMYEIPCYGGNGIRGYVREKSYTGNYPIIGRQGALCGNVQYATGEFHATEHAVLVSLLKNDNSVWVYHLLKLMDLFRYHTGAAQPGLAVKTLNTVEVIVADKRKQDQFAAFVEQTDKSKLAIQQSLDKLELLKKSLMQEYFG